MGASIFIRMITTPELLGLLASYAYATGLLAFGELLWRKLRWPQSVTRKIVHIGAGMWVWAIPALFERWQIGLIPFASFIVINFLLYRFRVLDSMDAEDSSPGTIYFALAITVLFVICWRPDGPLDRLPIAMAGIMALTWGDALAALVGQRWGAHRYRIGNSTRSWEGSLTMLFVSLLAIAITLLVLPGSSLSPYAPPIATGTAVLVAVVAACGATLAEAISPHGLDNLAVPFTTAAIVFLALPS
jgi:phytol kinase